MNLKQITPIAAAVVLSIGSMAVTSTAQAEIGANVGVSNFYLWRGVDASSGQAQVFGELKYTDKSGAYVGAWLSNHTAGNENNYYVGYAMKAGGIDLDFSYWNVTYPTTNSGKLLDSNVEEVVIGAGMKDFSASLVVDVDGDNEDYQYLALGYSMDKYSFTLGKWFGDKDLVPTYGHVTVGYAVTDDFTFSVNKAFGGDIYDAGTGPTVTDKDLLLNIAYTKSFDVK